MNREEPAFPIFHKVLIHNRNLRLAISGIGAALCLAAILIYGFYTDEQNRIVTILLAGGALLGIGMSGIELLNYEVRKSELYKLLHEAPEHIVWVYYYKVESLPYGIKVGQMSTLFFKTSDGNSHELRCSESKSLLIMDALRTTLPHCTFGYSAQKDQLFRADPNLLRR